MVAPVAEMLMYENSYKEIKGDVLFVAHQDILLTPDRFKSLLSKYNIKPNSNSHISLEGDSGFISDTSLLSHFNINSIDFMDVNSFKGDEIIMDLSHSVDDKYCNKYDFIFNGSCLDNIFNPANAIINLSKMLKPGGVILSFEHISSRNGPYTMCSPGWFFDYYVQNGFADCVIYVGKFTTHEELYHGPWDLYFHNWYGDKNGAAPKGNINEDFIAIIIAEKGTNTTNKVQPIQHVYRNNQADKDIFEKNLSDIFNSKRPIYNQSNNKPKQLDKYLIELGKLGSF